MMNMYLVKIQITLKGYKPMFFQGILSEEGCKIIKVGDLKKIAENGMIKYFIEANKDQINASEMHNITAKVVEFKKRRCDFVFNVNKILTQKQK